jgi:hypothetical protein
MWGLQAGSPIEKLVFPTNFVQGISYDLNSLPFEIPSFAGAPSVVDDHGNVYILGSGSVLMRISPEEQITWLGGIPGSDGGSYSDAIQYPAKRSNAGMWYKSGAVYMYGGVYSASPDCSGRGGCKCDCSWTKNAPCPLDMDDRSCCFACCCGAQTMLDDLWKFDLNSKRWMWINGSSTGGVARFSGYPGSSSGFSFWSDENGLMYLLGG